MLIGIFSDTHFGFGSDDRNKEAFDRFDEAINIFKENNVDFILHAGDLFDEAVPKQEVWLRTFNCFNKNNGKVSFIEKNHFAEKSVVEAKGIPIIAIHGTHEFRGKDFANALDILEEANCLVHVHAGYAKLEKNGEEVFVHGMGGIPEKNARDALFKYSPIPFPNKTNLLLLHQSFKEFLPFDDESIASLSLGDLPNGFDLIINGHLHWRDEQNIDGKRFLLTGSTIFTQMKKLEAQKEKGVFLFDSSTKQINFIPFKNQRKLFYEKIVFKDAVPEDIIKTVEEKIKFILLQKNEIKPLIRFNLKGTLAKGFSQKDILINLSDFEEKAIFSISKEFDLVEFQKKIEYLKKLQLEKKSILDMGIDILEKNISEAKLEGFDTRRVFELLSNDEMEKAEELLLK